MSGVDPDADVITVNSTGQYVVVVGQFNGWGAAMIDTTAGLPGHGAVIWAKSDMIPTGQANAVTFDNSPHTPELFLAGSVTGVSPHASCMAVAELDVSTGNFTPGFNNGCYPLAFAPSGCTCAYATAILDLDDAGAVGDSGSGGGPGLAVAGYTTYAGGSDYTLAEIYDRHIEGDANLYGL